MQRFACRSLGAAPAIGMAAALLVVGSALLAEEKQDGPIHRDHKVMEDSAVEVTRSLLLEDSVGAKRALDRLYEFSPPITPEIGNALGEKVYVADKAFHTTLQRAREYAAAGNVEAVFDEYVWVQRTCRQCHRLMRSAPAPAPLLEGGSDPSLDEDR